MSHTAVLAVLEIAPDAWSTGTRMVAVCLAERVNDAHNVAWPSLADIARRSGLHPRNVRRHLAVLEEDGWITREEQTAGSGKQTANLYRWHPPLPIRLPDATTPDTNVREGATATPDTSAGEGGDVRQGGRQRPGEGGASATPVAPGASATPGTQELTSTESEPPQATTSLGAVHSLVHRPTTTSSRRARAAPPPVAAAASP